MKKIVNVLTHPIFVSAVGLILIALLIWFAGPVIKFGEDNTAPLASQTVRLLCIMVVVILWGLNNLRIQMRNNKSNQALVDDLEQNQAAAQGDSTGEQASEEIHQLGQRFNQALVTLKKLKFSGVGGKKALYELPWYIIVGPPGSGKTTALVNSGLEFPLADQFGKGALQGVGGTRNCDWWFTNQAVLIDTAGRYTTQDSHRVIDSSAWEGFLNLLKRNRRRRPINGAIVAISLLDMLTQTEEERAQHAKLIRTRIDELMEKLEIRFPVYLMFTKVDLVSGFREFFEDLNKDEREQVWGVSLPNAPKPSQSPDFDYFSEQFGTMLNRLYDRVLQKVHQERNVQRRGEVYGFPQQMENLKGIAEDFVRQTFVKNRYQLQPYLRGVYFSSGTQDGTPIDRLMTAVTQNFGFSRESSQASHQQGKSYFLSRLFKDVIFPESELVGSNTRYESLMRWGQRIAIGSLAAITVTVMVVWSGSVTRNKMYMSQVQEQLDEFTEEQKKISPYNKDIRAILPPLNALAKASIVYDQEEHPWLSGIGLYDSRVDTEANRAYELHLKKLLLPQLLQDLEETLALGHQGGDLYNTFRMYMMFNKQEKMEQDLIVKWFKERWDAKFSGEATRRQELKAHLDKLMAIGFEPVELNPMIVRQTRSTLLRVPVSQRIYARVKNQPIFKQEINLVNQFGELSRTAFSMDETTQRALTIPVIFTIDGFKAVDFEPDSPVLTDVENERWLLDEDDSERVDFVKDDLDEISEEVKNLYFIDYIDTWTKVFKALEVADFKSVSQANDVLMGMIDPIYSPLRSVLQVSAANTELTPPIAGLDTAAEKAPGKLGKAGQLATLAASKRPTTKVDKRFAELHALMRESSGGQAPIDTWVQRVGQLQAFMAEITMAPDPSQKAYEIAKGRYQSGASNPIVSLKSFAKNAPEPLGRWLNTLADESWRVVMSSANQYVNSEWKNRVYAPYSRALAGRYPLNGKAGDELALYDFSEFFKPNGTVDAFFNEFMKPFIDTRNNWNNRVVDGYSIGFSNSSITQVRRALNIKNVFFRDNPETPTISLELRPVSMDEQDAQFTLDVGDTRLEYKHGPKFWKPVSWSGADEGKRIRIVFEDLGGSTYESTFTGPWAWFRLMDASNVRSTSRSNVYNITFSASRGGEPHKIVYEGKTKSVNNPFSNNLLGSFKAPGSL